MKGDKNLKKILNKEKTAEEEKKFYEGALEIGKHVKVKFSGTWEIAKIIEIKPNKFLDENPNKKNEYSYDYYIHYIDFNRRNDKWITRTEIFIDDDDIQQELKNRELKEKEAHGSGNPFENDEHEGLDRNCLITHEEATKVKTIDEIEMGKYRCETW